jgi:hypothetical protein
MTTSPHNGRYKGATVAWLTAPQCSCPTPRKIRLRSPSHRRKKRALACQHPTCRMVAITSLETGALIDAAIGPHAGKQTGETSLHRNIMNSLNKDGLLLGDSLYCTYFIMIELAARGVDFLFEQNGPRRRKVNFGLGRKLGAKDHIIKLEKPKIKPDWMTKETYDSSPSYLSIRAFKAGGKVLVTSILCAKEMPKKVLSNHDKKRGSVEVDIRNIKTTMGMEILSCKTPDMVVKEVCVYLLAYNIIHLLMMGSALINEILPRAISFKHCIQLWLAWCQQGTLTDIEQNTAIFTLMAQRKVGDRPGRMEPRAIKRRPTRHHPRRRRRHSGTVTHGVRQSSLFTVGIIG